MMCPSSVIRVLNGLLYEGRLPRRVMTHDSRIARPPKSGDMDNISEIYIRNDGWSIGADYLCAGTVFALWKGSWVVQLRRQSWGWQVTNLRPEEKENVV